MKNVLIVGYGVVGHNLAKDLEKLNPDIYDKYKVEENTKKNIKYDFAFICVDTPFNEKGDCDITEVVNAINENDADIYIIKSTILPTTTRKIKDATNKHIVFSPEYYGGTQHCNNFNFDFTILGGDKNDCVKIIQLLQSVYDGRHTFKIVEPEVAELTKYMENSFLATKVSFCIQFYEIAKQLGINYEEVRECFILDERVGKSHTFVYEEKPYWDSHCLNKDVPAIANKFDAPMLKGIIDYNNDLKKRFKK